MDRNHKNEFGLNLEDFDILSIRLLKQLFYLDFTTLTNDNMERYARVMNSRLAKQW